MDFLSLASKGAEQALDKGAEGAISQQRKQKLIRENEVGASGCGFFAGAIVAVGVIAATGTVTGLAITLAKLGAAASMPVGAKAEEQIKKYLKPKRK